jgi:L-asparaginase / beta-aspartyl-peptidase
LWLVSIVFVHGGVSGLVKEEPPLDVFVEAGTAQGHFMEAVESAVQALEDDPRFNAGFGSVLNSEGGLEMDAGIVNGVTGRAGGVANVTVRHPISLARRVLEQTPHVLLTGSGARALGADMEQLEDTSEEERERWTTAKAKGDLHPAAFGSPEYVDTVGAVALDEQGRLAAGSSTGGVFAKMPGRVGDAPIFGAGTFASPAAAVVGTGVGEVFLESLACLRVATLIEKGAHPQEACEEVIALIGHKSSLSAGLMALDASGAFGAAYRGGSWAVGGPEGVVRATRMP